MPRAIRAKLYEAALEGVLLFTILAIATYRYKALTRPGTIFGLFLIFYGLFRSLVEFFREPHLGHPLDIGVLHAGHRLFYSHDPAWPLVGPPRASKAGHRSAMSALAREPVPDASLAARLHARIARDGPLTVAEFMQACLSDEAAGVYASRQPIGGKGDFITSPEISQIFGELVGLWAVAVWQSMGEPSPRDRRRAWTRARHSDGGRFPRLARRSEISRQRLRGAGRDEPASWSRRSARRLKDAGVPLRWYAALDAVPEGPLIVIANEFVDALPIRQFIRRGEAWRERLIASDGEGGFTFIDGEAEDEDRDLPANGTGRRHPGNKTGRRRRSCTSLAAVLRSLRSPPSSSTTVTRSPASATRCKPCADIASPMSLPIQARPISPPMSISPISSARRSPPG